MTATIEPTVPATETRTTGEVIAHGKGELTGMLADLALTASKGGAPEVFTVIRLHTEGGRLHGWSSDRFRLAHAAVTVDGELPGVVCIDAADVKKLVSALRNAPDVTFRVDTATSRLEFSDYANAVTFRSPDLEGHAFPDYSKVATDELPTGDAPVVFRAAHLADFAKVASRRREHVGLVGNGKRATHICIGGDYRAWLMPLRFDADSWLPSVF